MGEQAMHTLSSRSLGDVLVQISETQRRLTAEMEGVFRWFQIEVLQAMEKKVKLDEEYMDVSLKYAAQHRSEPSYKLRGTFRDSLENSEYMQYLRQSQQEILKEEERRYRFLAEKHCGLSQSLLFLINKSRGECRCLQLRDREHCERKEWQVPGSPAHSCGAEWRGSRGVRKGRNHRWRRRRQRWNGLGEMETLERGGKHHQCLFQRDKGLAYLVYLLLVVSQERTLLLKSSPQRGPLQLKADGWKEKMNETKGARPRTPTPADQEAQLRGSVSSLLQTVARDEDMSWARREQQALGRVPSRAPSPLPSRSRSSSVGESLGLTPGRAMRALVSHPASSNPKLLSFTRGETVMVLLLEPRNGWLYGRTDTNLRQGWFPAAYVAPAEDQLSSLSTSGASARSSSMNNLLDPADPSESKSYGDVPPPATPIRRASVDVRSMSPDARTSHPAGRSYGELGTNPFATVKLRPTTTNDRSAPRVL
ncbi:hypothetical protein NHX12_018738 [Muraenolepis orangiensis]|uniref:Brain-specific angiogenesis inhibitor 1-associated protein 2-like protein 2 n=1 Tax=Muraenolepis orangiensis TaxID=630683 RepID=A0A9Q0EZL1_9TELE|nr:hypothetical protein NHX12_018738 [Muraenolepis orangiensis]